MFPAFAPRSRLSQIFYNSIFAIPLNIAFNLENFNNLFGNPLKNNSGHLPCINYTSGPFISIAKMFGKRYFQLCFWGLKTGVNILRKTVKNWISQANNTSKKFGSTRCL